MLCCFLLASIQKHFDYPSNYFFSYMCYFLLLSIFFLFYLVSQQFDNNMWISLGLYYYVFTELLECVGLSFAILVKFLDIISSNTFSAPHSLTFLLGLWWYEYNTFCCSLTGFWDFFSVLLHGSLFFGLLKNFYWHIVDLQCFRYTAKWFNFIYIYVFFRLFSFIGYYKILNIVPCAIHIQ